MEEMLRYRWPGNVRELKNVIERAVVLTRGEYIDHDDLVLSTLRTAGDTDSGMLERANGARSSRRRWPTSRRSTFWPRSRRPAGTRAARPPSWASSARRSTARFAATIWSKSERTTIDVSHRRHVDRRNFWTGLQSQDCSGLARDSHFRNHVFDPVRSVIRVSNCPWCRRVLSVIHV